MNKSQDHISIADIKDGVILLKDGGAVLVLKTSAVNFGLLSGEEQMAIIGSFAQMLNSLSFALQIVIRSKKLDISSYLKLLDKALQLQTNPLLSAMMIRYRDFIQSLIRDNEVLDKSFYVVIPLSALEIGITVKNPVDKLKKAQTVLLPRKDQLIRQLSRVGLNTEQLSTVDLIKLFYDIYNPTEPLTQAQIPQVNLQAPQVSTPPLPQTPPANIPSVAENPVQRSTPRNHPFVVEELTDSV
jgi:hypothetical protein